MAKKRNNKKHQHRKKKSQEVWHLNVEKDLTPQKFKRLMKGLSGEGRQVRAKKERGIVSLELSNLATGVLRLEVHPDGREIKVKVRDAGGNKSKR
jgi:hypothetical protein